METNGSDDNDNAEQVYDADDLNSIEDPWIRSVTLVNVSDIRNEDGSKNNVWPHLEDVEPIAGTGMYCMDCTRMCGAV